MTRIVEQIYAELLRYLYVLSIGRWSPALRELSLLVLGAAFGFTAWRLVAMAHHASRPATPRKENA